MGTKLFRFNIVIIMDADVLVPCVVRTPASMYSVLPIYRGHVYRGIGYIAVACWTPFFGAQERDIFRHTMGLLWEKFQWILPLYMEPISFQSKASVVCSVTAAIFIGFCLKKVNVFSEHIGKKTNEYLNSTEQITRNWNVDQLSVLITSWDII